MQQQLVVTHTIRQTEIPALLDSWVTNASSVKVLCPQQIACPYIFVNYTNYTKVLVCLVSVKFLCLI